MGLRPVDAGMMILAYFLGNLGMKAVTTPTLRRFGFRTVMVVNGVIASASIMACAAISPETPQALVVALMLIAGLSRSMQFTALNTLAFADIDAAQRSSAATLSCMLQQVAMLFGVAVAAAILNLSQIARARPALDLVDFRIAFLVIGAIGLVAALRFLVLPPAAGAEVSGHTAEELTSNFADADILARNLHRQAVSDEDLSAIENDLTRFPHRPIQTKGPAWPRQDF